jgi:hypothetical protein
MSRSFTFVLMGAAVLAFASLPAGAAPTEATEAFLVSLSASAPRISKEQTFTRASSTAQCWDGSTVTCTGTSSSGVDSDCWTGQQGFCWGSSTGTRYCPACPSSCSAFANCPNGNYVFCEGSTSCFAMDGCWVECDGWWTACPGARDCPI